MFGRLAIVALAVGLASCAGIEPAGRNAQRARPAPTATAPVPTPQATLPPPQTTTAAPTPSPQLTPPPTRQSAPVTAGPPPTRQTAPVTAGPAPTPAPTVAAPQVAAPPSREPAPSQARARSDDDDIVVPGQVQTQVPPPAGDPRTNEERRADVRQWDQCVMQVQGAFDSDPMSPQLTTPEEYCAQSLGMASRTSVPVARQQRRR